MATITVVVDAPDYSTESFKSGIVHLGVEFVRLVRAQVPIDDNISLREITVEGDQANVGEPAPKPPRKTTEKPEPHAKDRARIKARNAAKSKA